MRRSGHNREKEALLTSRGFNNLLQARRFILAMFQVPGMDSYTIHIAKPTIAVRRL
jgi:hypothetical protein